MIHIALPAALAVHNMPGKPYHRSQRERVLIPTGFLLAWELEVAFATAGHSQENSVRTWAAWLMCASVRAVV